MGFLFNRKEKKLKRKLEKGSEDFKERKKELYRLKKKKKKLEHDMQKELRELKG